MCIKKSFSKLRFLVLGLILIACLTFTTCDALGGDPTYTIVFNDGNGRSEAATFRLGYSNALDKTIFELKGHTFVDWSTTPDGDSVVTRENVNRLITRVGQTVTLYAIWRAHTYTIRYNPNESHGGVGYKAEDVFTFDKPQRLRLAEDLGFTHSEYIFHGWTREQYSLEREFYDGAGGEIALNLTAENGGEVTLYALWRPAGGVITPPGEFTFAFVEDIGYTVTRFNGTATNVEIPSTHNGWSVVAIGDNAFEGSHLTNVTIPNTVITIGNAAFQGNSLESVIIPNSVTSIGSRAFAHNELDSVTIGDSVKSIGDFAFQDNTLDSVTIPDSVESIGMSAFFSNQLTSITIPISVTFIGDSAFAGNQLDSVFTPFPSVRAADDAWGGSVSDWRNGINERVISSSEGLQVTGGTVTGFNGTTRVLVIPHTYNGVPVIAIGSNALFDKELTNVIIPDGVTSIGVGAFANNQLTSVTIPDNVTSIGMSAFSNNELTSVTIPDSVTSIGVGAFANNELTSVTIGNSVASIEGSAFWGNELTNITIPDNVESIGNGAFQNNELTSVTIGNSVTSIGGSAFRSNRLTEVIIPDSVTSIGFGAFSNNQLTSVTIPDSITSTGNSAFSHNQLMSVNIPDSVTSIGSEAFAHNQLASVNIPDSVTSIMSAAFAGNQLTSIIIPSSVTSIEPEAFDDNANLTTITIPSNINMFVSPSDVTDTNSHWSRFVRDYNATGRLAGTYVRSGIGSNTTWALQP